MKTLELVKIFEDDNYRSEVYVIGSYEVIRYIKTYENGEKYISYSFRCDDEFIPELFYQNNKWKNKENCFVISTTTYGALDAENIKKVVAGYEEALEVVETLTKQFL